MPAELPRMTIDEEGVVPHRDRILLLGRRKAGKTVFLARLYEQGWRGGDELHMRACEGSLHTVCMDIVAELAAGRWPAATVGSLSSGVEVTWRGRNATMVLLDYPGEVFRRAFVEGGSDEQSQSLLDHVDRAAAVILLIDPGNVHIGDVDELVDDDFGMVQAVDRIRRSVGGENVPIAIALTKCDVHVGLVRAEGGARGFVEKHLPNLLRYGGTVRMFATAAVRTRVDAGGRAIPSTRHGSAGLIDTLVYCMRHVGRQMDADAASRQAAVAAEHRQEAARRDAVLVRRDRGRWVAFWVGAAVLCIALTGLAMVLRPRLQTDLPVGSEPLDVQKTIEAVIVQKEATTPSLPPVPFIQDRPVDDGSTEPEPVADES
ncbi:MAG: hypothetical protein P8I91_06445 [Phycisphaerales bacterium]|nr:hypothetical protein [Phycisphaerales bacterium]